MELSRGQISAELTTTLRCGFHKYSYNTDNEVGIYLDLKHRDKVLESGMKVVGTDEIEGFRFSKAWADKQMVFFVMKFSEPFSGWKISRHGEVVSNLMEAEGVDLRGVFYFPGARDKKILIKVGISAVSIEGARQNLRAGIPDWDFDGIREKAQQLWEMELGRIKVKGGTYDQQVDRKSVV